MGGGTNIMTPEESQAAQAEALAKMEEAKKGVVHTRTRADKRGELKAKKSSKGMWIMLGVGGLIAIGGVVALLMFAFADDSSAPRRKKTAPAPEQSAPAETAPAPEPSAPAEAPKPKKAEAPPADDSSSAAAAPAPAPAPKKKAPPPAEAAPAASAPAPKKVASGKVLGTLTLNPGPNVAVSFGGNAMPKQVGAFNLPVTADSGTAEVGDDSTPYKIGLDYAVANGALTVKVSSTPWAIVSVGGTSKGKTPVADIKIEKTMTVVELKKPGSDTGMTVRLLFKPN
jgi:cytoskeletal protein RodZ